MSKQKCSKYKAKIEQKSYTVFCWLWPAVNLLH